MMHFSILRETAPVVLSQPSVFKKCEGTRKMQNKTGTAEKKSPNFKKERKVGPANYNLRPPKVFSKIGKDIIIKLLEKKDMIAKNLSILLQFSEHPLLM